MDTEQGPVFDAQVRLSSDSGAPVEQVTQSSGITDFKEVACGAWTVLAAKEGFEPATQTVQITSGANVEITLTLNPKMQSTSVEVSENVAPVEQTSTQQTELRPAEVKTLPNNPATVSDALPLVPGVVRARDGELKIDGTDEQRSSLIVNQTDVTDPATGKFGQTTSGGRGGIGDRPHHSVSRAVRPLHRVRDRGGDQARRRKMALRSQRSVPGFPHPQLPYARHPQ